MWNHALEKCPWNHMETPRAGTGWGSLRQSLMVRATLNMHHRSWWPRPMPLGGRRWRMAGYHHSRRSNGETNSLGRQPLRQRLVAPCWRPCWTVQRLVVTQVQRLVATKLATSARHHLGTRVRGRLSAFVNAWGER